MGDDFLAAIGAALTAGSTAAGRAQREKLERDKEEHARKLQLMRMALEQKQADQAESLYKEQRGDRMLARIGPGGIADANAAQIIAEGGLESTLAPEPDWAPTPGTDEQGPPSAGMNIGRRVIPNASQQTLLDDIGMKDRERVAQTRAMTALEDPRFYNMPELQRAVVWQQAGLAGNPPASLEDWKQRQNYEHGLRMQEIGAQGQNQMNAAMLRAEATADVARMRIDAASTGKPATGMQQKVLGFYNRMKSAADDMERLEASGQLTTSDLEILNNSPLPDIINNRALSTAGQQYADAARRWAEARLRKESGAAISAGEFGTDRQMAIWQGSDLPELRKRKQGNRKNALQSFAVESGKAYEDYYGSPFQNENTAVPGADVTAGGFDFAYDRDPQTGKLVRKK